MLSTEGSLEAGGTNLFDIGITCKVEKKVFMILERGVKRHFYSLKPSANQSFGVEDSISWVHGSLIFGSIADQTFFGGKCYIRWCCAIPLCRESKWRFGVKKEGMD